METEHEADVIKRFRGYINDLISVLDLPNIWGGNQPSQIVTALLDVLLSLLRLNFVHSKRVQLNINDLVSILAENRAAIRLQEARVLSEQKRSAEQIHFQKALLDMIDQAVIATDTNGIITYCNRFAERLYGWSAEEVMGCNIVDITPAPGSAAAASEIFSRLRRGEEWKGECLVQHRNGTIFPVLMDASPIYNKQNMLVGTIQISIDISERKRAEVEMEQRIAEATEQFTAINEELRKEVTQRRRREEELRRSEAYLAEAQRISHTGSWAWNASTGELVWSLEQFRIFGLDPANFKPTKENTQRLIHPEDLPFVEQTLERAVRERSDFELDYRIVRPDGSIRYHRGLGHPIVKESGELEFIGTVVDVTEHKRAEEALYKAQAELAHVTRLTTIGELTGSIAHEVNQPLGAIVTSGEVCLSWLADASPNLDEVREAVTRIIRDANRATDVIARIRTLLSKAGTEKEQLNINDVIEEVGGLVQGEVQRNAVTLRTELAPDPPPVLGNRVQLQQVMLNLIMNGIEAMSTVEDRPRELVITTQREQRDKVRVSVQDSGIGLDPRTIDRLFNAFYTTKREGMGMGLSICRSIVDAHSGRLWATPNEGPGATFQFTLPIYEAVGS